MGTQDDPTYRIEKITTVFLNKHGGNHSSPVAPITIVEDRSTKFRRGADGLSDVFEYDNRFQPVEYENGEIQVSWRIFERVGLGEEREITIDEAAQLVADERRPVAVDA